MLYAVLHYATWSMNKQVPAPADPPHIDPPTASKIRIWPIIWIHVTVRNPSSLKSRLPPRIINPKVVAVPLSY